MAAHIAQSYVGKYQSSLGILTIGREGGVLYVELESNPKEELLPDKANIFYSADAWVQLHFLAAKERVNRIEITAGIAPL